MSTRLFRCTALLVTLATLVATRAMGDLPPTGVRWQADLDEARALAEKEQKLLLIHFHAKWCAPCLELENRVFNQPTVAKIVHELYVPVKLNADDYPATAERFGVRSLPTEVVITPDEEVIEKFNPPATPMAYVSKLGDLAKGFAYATKRDFATSPMSSPTTQPLTGTRGHLPANSESLLAAPRLPEIPQAVVSNPFAQGQRGTPVQSGAPGVATAAPAPAQPAATPAAPPVHPVVTENQFVASAATTAQPSAVAVQGTTDEAKPAEVDPSKIQLPPGAPPVGFFGYCCVTMKEKNDWQPGLVEWGAIHRGRTYLFTSQELRDKFLTNPDSYAPALAGADPVLAIDEKKTEPGQRSFGLSYAGQVYMFKSHETLMQFLRQPEKYATEVRQAMNAPTERVVR